MSSMIRIAIALVVALCAFWLIELLLNPAILVSLVVGAGLGAVTIIVLKAFATGEDPAEAVRETVREVRETVQEPETAVKERLANEQLLRATTDFVTSGVAPALVQPVKGLVEPLREVVRRALEFAPDTETTFNLVKLASEELPQQLRAFVNLSDDDRAAKADTFTSQLSELAGKVKELTGFIDQGNADAFAAQSQFIDMKFG